MNDAPQHLRRQRRILIGVALMFFAPLGVSFLLYYGQGWHPGGKVNHGVLIEPPRPLPDAGLAPAHTLQGKWTLLLVQRGACGQLCSKRLYDTRQVRTALDRDMQRVQRVLIAAPECCEAKLLEMHRDLIRVPLAGAVQPLLALLPEPDAHRVYLIDPLGNAMMFYEPVAEAKGMLEDLKRLLRLSQIG